MNQTQRKFLIDKIQEKNKLEIKSLESKLLKRPNLEAHILHEELLEQEAEEKKEFRSILKEYVKNEL